MAWHLDGAAHAASAKIAGSAHSTGAGYAAGLLTWLLCASVFVVVKGTAHEIPPFTMSFTRLMLLLVLMLPLVHAHFAEMRALLRTRGLEVLGVGAIGMGLSQALMYLALHTTSATNVGIVSGMAPMITLVLARLLLGEAMTLWQALGSLIAFGGIIAISVKGSLALLMGLHIGMGEIMAFCAASMVAAYTVMMKRSRFPLPPLPLLTLLITGSVISLFPLFLWEQATGKVMHLTITGVGAIFYAAIIGGGLMYSAYNWCIGILGPARAGTLIYSQIVFVTFFAWLFLGEQLFWYHYLGIALVAIGIVFVVTLGPKATRAAP